MINEIFTCPIRKYHIDNQQEQIEWAESEYNRQRFTLPSPFKTVINQIPEWISKPYEEIAESFLKDLGIFDNEIEVEDATNLPTPDITNNIPGIIFINAERIEYFVKSGNKLRQLRRGTLGTGVKELHKKGDELFNQGIDETIPYQDKLLVQNFTTTNSLVSGNYVEREYILDWNPASRNEMEVFLGGQRLTKGYLNTSNNAVKDVFHPTTGMDSPEGDITVTLPTYPQSWGLERDGFRVQYDSNTNSTKIYVYSLADGEKLTVIRKQGQLWNDIVDSTTTKSLGRSQNPIAQFIRAKEVKLPN